MVWLAVIHQMQEKSFCKKTWYFFESKYFFFFPFGVINWLKLLQYSLVLFNQYRIISFCFFGMIDRSWCCNTLALTLGNILTLTGRSFNVPFPSTPLGIESPSITQFIGYDVLILPLSSFCFGFSILHPLYCQSFFHSNFHQLLFNWHTNF